MGKIQKILVTGSAGLIGSESVKFFCDREYEVVGIDNDMRRYFFGSEASTDWNRKQLENKYKNYIHYTLDVRDEAEMEKLFKKFKYNLIIHTAAQPSHDWSVKEPLTDFSINATATLLLLECTRKYSPEAVFIFTSTNKVYGDTPNYLPFIEMDTRWELPKNHSFYKGINESMSIDNSKHSIFGASKVAADVMVQEYGKYFGLKTHIFRGGCLTGPAHSGTKLHGFLAYLIRCIARSEPYTIIGYQGKQVRDNIHSFDLVNAFFHIYQNPRCGEVYNIGGSRTSNTSILEAIAKTEKILRKKSVVKYVNQPRSGDHKWYISDVSKFKEHFPKWNFTYNNDQIIEDICRYGHFT